MIKDEMVQCDHGLSGHEFEQTPGDSRRQRSLACCRPWGLQRLRRDLTTKQKQQIAMLDMQHLLKVFVEQVKVESVSHSVMSGSLQPHGL